MIHTHKEGSMKIKYKQVSVQPQSAQCTLLRCLAHCSVALSCQTFHLPCLKASAGGNSTVLDWLQSLGASVTITPGREVGGNWEEVGGDSMHA